MIITGMGTSGYHIRMGTRDDHMEEWYAAPRYVHVHVCTRAGECGVCACIRCVHAFDVCMYIWYKCGVCMHLVCACTFGASVVCACAFRCVVSTVITGMWVRCIDERANNLSCSASVLRPPAGLQK